MTTITLNLYPEIEEQLWIEATKQGIEPHLYILKTLEQHLQSTPSSSQPTEAELLQQINIGFSATIWEQYHTLIAKRHAETLTYEEYDQLIKLSNRLENLNVNRIKALIQLATLRKQSLTNLMESLGINLFYQIDQIWKRAGFESKLFLIHLKLSLNPPLQI